MTSARGWPRYAAGRAAARSFALHAGSFEALDRLDGARRKRAIHLLESDDDLDRAAVDAPGRSGDVARLLGAQKHDRRRDLADLRPPADRAPVRNFPGRQLTKQLRVRLEPLLACGSRALRVTTSNADVGNNSPGL